MTDAELIERAKRGDRRAFGELAGRHQAKVFAACLRLSGNPRDADELAHDALVEAWLKLGQLEDPERFSGWLRTLTLNLFRMWYRRRRRDLGELPEELPAPEPEPDDGHLHAAISRSLLRLSFNHRVALVLHYLEGLSYDELAAFLDIPAGTVMSRLYRGRRALGSLVRAETLEEEPMSGGDIQGEVLAEIEVLLELFREQPEAAERLSVILERSPERLGQLVASADRPEVMRSAGALLPRLGPAAIRVALDAAFGADPRARANAATALGAAVARYQTLPWPGGPDASAAPESYLFVDQLLAHPAPAEAKAALLLELLPAVEDRPVGDLLVDLLITWRPAAPLLLLGAYGRMQTVADLAGSKPLLNALCRTGTPFLAALLDDLGAAQPERRLLALAGVEAVAKLVDREACAESSDEEFALEARRGAALRSRDLAPEVLQAVRDRVAGLLGSAEPRERDAAIRAVAALLDSSRAASVRACLESPVASTRLAAIRAVANLGDFAAAAALAKIATGSEPAERIAAVEALGHLKAWSAKELLLELAESADEQLQAAAVAALGELGGDEMEALLRRFTASGSLARRKAAAGALFGGTRPKREPSALSRRVWEKLRGPDAKPVAEISMEGALRYALPEPRPYEEKELTQRLSRVCVDFSSVRRLLVERGLMTREDAVYQLTPLGAAVWRCEQFIGR